MTTHIEQTATRARRANGKTPRSVLILENKIRAAMHAVDEVIDGLTEEQRDPFLLELIKTLELMQ